MIKERRTPTSQKVAYYRSGSAGSRMTSDDVDARLIERAALLHVSGITPALSPQAAATLHFRRRHGPRGGRSRLLRPELPQQALGR